MLRSRAQADQLVLAVLREHADSLLRVARRHSLCPDDAQDAYQRATEIFLRHAPTLDATQAYKWLHTVIKHEAMHVRAQRARSVTTEEVDLDRQPARRLPTADEQVASFDLLTRSAEALARLKPQEVRALWLRAQGHSYQEIAELCDWSYTKVNRCLTEGRRAFIERSEQIASGEECRRWEPVLSALVDGEASAKDLAGVRPHLRHCPACRARLHDLGDVSRRVAALLPVPVAAAVTDHGGLLARCCDAIAGHVQERVVLSAAKLQTGVEAALPGKLAVVAASAAALGGGVAVERAATRPPSEGRVAARLASPRPTPATHPPVRDPAAPASTTADGPTRPPTRHTARREFRLSHDGATTASNGTAGREFAEPEASDPVAASAAAAPAPAPSPEPAGGGRDARTAAAEFGG